MSAVTSRLPLLRSIIGARSFSAVAGQANKKTALYDFNVAHKAKMVPFCGWQMPIQYDEGILGSHLWTREHASLFDVSHMLQIRLSGKDRHEFIEKLVVGDIKELPVHSGTLSLITNEKGGIIDDTIINNYEDHLYIVLNAGCADKDMAHIQPRLKEFVASGKDVTLDILSDEYSLLALQGPEAVNVLSRLTKQDFSKQYFMTGRRMNVLGSECVVTRCGYTGEDGFEISVPSKSAVALAEALVAEKEVKLAGLGPRDSLRVEAGLCLYGNDITEDTTPIEGSLLWTIGKRRRAEGGFLGSDVILRQIKEGVAKKRVGLTITGAIAREHAQVLNDKEEVIGEVVSGTFSPVLKQAIAMAYVPTALSKIGTQLQVSIRNKSYPATVSKMPFVKNNYYKGQ